MTGGRVLRVVLAAVLVLTLGAHTGPAAPEATWATLDAAQVGLTGENGTHTRVERRTARLTVVRVDGGPDGVTVTLPATAGERFFGLGARYGRLDLRGQVLHNRTADAMGRAGVPGTYSPMPFLLSSRGYGLHLDTTADAVFELSAPDSVTIHVAADEVVVQLLTGPEPAAVIREHARLIGLPPVPPEWGLGVWKSLVGGTDRVLADVDELIDSGVPLDAV